MNTPDTIDLTSLVRGGMLPSLDDPTEGVPCPCGCGQMLHPYNGARPLVCFQVWRLVADEDTAAVMNFCVRPTDREAAARRVLNLAAAVRESRATHPAGRPS